MLTYDQLIIGVLTLVILPLLWMGTKSFTDELSKRIASRITLKQEAETIEAVKKIFNEKLELFKKDIQLDIVREVEPLKASLSKENIAYQIYTTEYIKMRFERLDELYAKLYELEKHFWNVFDYSNEYNQEEFFERQAVLNRDFYKPAEDSFAKAFIYIDDDVSDSVKKLLNESKNGFSLAVQFYGARHAARGGANQALKEKYYEVDDQRKKAIEKVNLLLKEVEVKFKRNLVIA